MQPRAEEVRAGKASEAPQGRKAGLQRGRAAHAAGMTPIIHAGRQSMVCELTVTGGDGRVLGTGTIAR